jgi:putative peptide zinc metalloprotease protein
MYKNATTLQKQVGWAAVTFFIYTILTSWQIALLIIVAIGFHESCHLLAAKKMKLRTKGFYLLPFIGGMAIVNDRYKRLSQQAFVVLAGPMGGGALAFITYGAYLLTGISFIGYSAYLMAFLNLFNLLPLSMMDGGQLMNTISYSLNRRVGFILQAISTVLAVVIISFFSPILAIFVGVIGFFPLRVEYRNQKFLKTKSWLCTDTYLDQPKPMTRTQIYLTGGTWILTVLSLGWLWNALKSLSVF